MPNHFVIHTVSSPDGIGDLVYFFNWLKIYNSLYKQMENKIVLFVPQIKKLILLLKDLQEIELDHPIFEYITLKTDSNNQYLIQYKDADKCAILHLQPGYLFGTGIDICTVFSDIYPCDSVTVIYVSCSYYYFNKNYTNVDFSLSILELDSQFSEQALGLGTKNLGLLTDLNGINGDEDIKPYLDTLTPELKLQIFQKVNITYQEAKDFLINTPIVFGYFQRFVNTYVLHAVYKSPFIQDAIIAGKIPLFFITTPYQCDEMPEIIINALKINKIRFVMSPWLNSKLYRAICAIFLNKETYSVALPSGDTSLTTCIQAGKFPFYAHKCIKSTFEAPDFKCTIFKDIQDIMVNAISRNEISESIGYTDCYETVRQLITRYTDDSSIEKMRILHPYIFSFLYASSIKEKKTEFYDNRGKHLTASCLTYFHDYVAPLILKRYSFFNKGLPKLISNYDGCSAELKHSISNNVAVGLSCT